MEWYGVVATRRPVAFGSGSIGQYGEAVLRVGSREECNGWCGELDNQQRSLQHAVDEGREDYTADVAVWLGITYSVKPVEVVLRSS